jgi:putative SOS response-associated peptidase YedK
MLQANIAIISKNSIIWPSRSYKSQGHLEFNIHEGPDLKDIVPNYEVNPSTNNKIIASYRKKHKKKNNTVLLIWHWWSRSIKDQGYI